MTKSKIVLQRVQAGDKVARDAATRNDGKVYLGDAAPVFSK